MADTMIPPLPGTSGTGLPPTLPPGVIGGGDTTTPTVPTTTTPTVPTVATPTTSTTIGGGAGCDSGVPNPLTGGGSTTQVGGANGGQVAQGGVVQGGGGMTGISALSPVLTQLTGVIQSLTQVIGTQVGGASGGGATAAPAASAQPAAPTTTPTTPAATTPAAPAANAATGAATVQGGGATAVDNTQLISALQGVIQAITALVGVLQSQVAGASGGGAPGKTPTQTAPTQTPPAPPTTPAPTATQVAGASGAGTAPQKEAPQKDATQVAGANGGAVAQSPTQAPPTKVAGANGGAAPMKAPQKPVQQPVQQLPGTAVGGVSGPPTKAPDKVPAKPVVQAPPVVAPPVVPAPPTQVGGANGGPVQQSPTQSPVQSPTQVGGVQGGGVAEGDVKLSNTDSDYRATITSKAGNSVSIWGDPHVTLKLDGKEESFLIGYGPGSVQLSDGSTVKWETYPVGDAKEKLLKNFSIDSAGTTLDRTVSTGDGKDESGITTALSDAQLREVATALRQYEGDWKLPLKLKDTPAQGTPKQG